MKNPYKELLPYIESDAHSFKGRTSETEEMYESFDRNEYLVCHADSGEGKSSIIEAGLIPKIKANCYFPVRIIFKSDEHFKKNNIDFDNVICGIIENEIEKLRSNNSISVNVVYPRRLTNSDDFELTNWEKELVDSYAWLKLRYERVTIDNLLYTPVLIFDQFEEVFTNPLSQEWTDKFFKWLQELSTDLCPQRIINELEKHLGNDDFPEINTQKYFKAIFSLRSEYVGKLDYWGIQRHYIPLLKSNRYLLRPLTIKGAKEVITQQDGYDGLNAVADEIINVLRRRQKGKNYVLNEKSELPCIPALFLSIICSRAFPMSQEELTVFMQRFVAEKDEDKETAINSLIESFYEKAVAECGIPSKDMGVIEDVLVNNEGSRQRVSSHADALKAIDFSTKYMEKLKDARLIRVIPEYNREDDSIEFVHDALCPIIAKRKELRLAEEVKKREEEKLREQAKKMRKRMRIVLAFALAVTVMAFVFFSLNQKLEKANQGMKVSLSHLLAEKVSVLVNDGDSYLARLLALEAIDNAPTPQAEASLRLATSYESAKLFEASVRYATFSPDGKLLATASCHLDSPSNKSIIIWDARSGSMVLTFGKSKEIDHVDFSADGNFIVSASRNDTISLWSIKTGEEICSFSGHKSCVKSAIFSSNDEKILSASRDGTAKLWNVKTGKEIRTFSGHTASVMSAQFSPDEKYVVTASGDSTIKIWNTLDGKEIRTLKGHKGSVYNAQYSKDGKRIISCSMDNTIKIWNAQTGDTIKTLIGHSMGVQFLGLSHNGKLLASASRDRTIKIWDLQTGAEIRTMSGHYDWVNSVVFSPNDSLVISAADDNIIKIWDLYPNERNGYIYIKSSSFANSACYSPNGKLLAIACGDSVKIHNIKTGVEIGNYTHSGEVKSVCFSSNGKLVVSGSFSAVKVWDISAKKIIKSLDYEGIGRASISPDGKYIVSAQGLVWNLETGDTIGVLRGHRSHTYSEEFSSDGKMIVTASHDRTIRIWDVATRKELNCLRGHTNQVLYASFSPDMKQIVSACSDGQIKQWNAQTGEEIRSLDGHRDMVECVSFSSDNKTIVSASWDGTVKIWDAATGCLLKTLQGHKGILTSAMFSPDRKQIVSTSQDGTVRIWNFPPIQQLIDKTRERFKNRQLTQKERRKYYIE